MVGFLLVIHIIVCILLIIVVLLQSGKSADLAGAFGGYGSQSTFGPRGAATFLSKMTTTLAILFMVTSLSLWLLQDKSRKRSVTGDDSVFGDEKDKPVQTQTTGTQKAAPVVNEAQKPVPEKGDAAKQPQQPDQAKKEAKSETKDTKK